MSKKDKIVEVKKQAKQLISESNGNEALIYLESETDYLKCSSEITQLKAKWSVIVQSEIRNDAKFEDINVEKNKFFKSVTDFIDKLKTSDLKTKSKNIKTHSYVKIWVYSYLEERKNSLSEKLKKKKLKIEFSVHELPPQHQPALILFDSVGIMTHAECSDFEQLSFDEKKHLWQFIRILFLARHPIIYIGSSSFIADEFSTRFTKATDTSFAAILEEQIELVEQKYDT